MLREMRLGDFLTKPAGFGLCLLGGAVLLPGLGFVFTGASQLTDVGSNGLALLYVALGGVVVYAGGWAFREGLRSLRR